MRANMEGSKLEGAIFKGALMPYGTKHPQHDALREVWLRGVSLRGILAVTRQYARTSKATPKGKGAGRVGKRGR
jgi:hypothetical protein